MVSKNIMKKLMISAIFIIIHFSLYSEVQSSEVMTEFYNQGFPGFTGGAYYMLDSSKLYWGGTFRFDLTYGLYRNNPDAALEDRGRWEIYLDVGLYGHFFSGHETVHLIFQYLIGFSTSFETPRSLLRDYLIPYIGIELGGICIEDTGNGFTSVPFLGINLFSYPDITMSLETGVLLNTIDLNNYLGVRGKINLNFVL